MLLTATNTQISAELAAKFGSVNQLLTGFANSYLWGIFYTILPIVGYWFLFEKKGEPGWKNLIPIYGSYMQYKLFFNTGKWWRRLISIIVLFISATVFFTSAIIWNQTKEQSMLPTITISSIVVLASFLWLLIICIQYDISICKRYGRGFLFILLMVFFTPLGVGILAYEVMRGRAHEVEY